MDDRDIVKTVQVISFSLSSSSDSKEKSYLNRCLKKFNDIPGWEQIYWARDLNRLSNINMYICWTVPEEAKNHYHGCDELGTMFSGMAIPPITTFFAQMRGCISSKYPIETIFFYFRSGMITEEDEILFDRQVWGAAQELQERSDQTGKIACFASGWVSSHISRRGELAKAYALMMAWSHLDALHSEKNDRSSIFINTMAPLKELATLGTETHLHTSLTVKARTERKCSIQ